MKFNTAFSFVSSLVLLAAFAGCGPCQTQDCLHIRVFDESTGGLIDGVTVTITSGRITEQDIQTVSPPLPAAFRSGCVGVWTVTVEHPQYDRLIHQHTATNDPLGCGVQGQDIELRLRPRRP